MGKFTKIMSEKSNAVIFLGTGTSQGVPAIGCKDPVCLSNDPRDKRLRASVMVIYNGLHFLIDCGPDFRQQMLRENLDRVDAILVTHEHNDHIIGMDDVRPLNFRTKKEMPVYSLPRVLNEVKNRFPYIFSDERYPGAPSVSLNPIGEEPFWIGKEKVIPLPVMHGSLTTLGFRIGNMAYMTDISFIPEKTIEKLAGLEVLVIDALRQGPEHHSHLVLPQAVEYANRIKAKQTFFTHMNHQIGFHEEVNRMLPPNMQLAWDGLSVPF